MPVPETIFTNSLFVEVTFQDGKDAKVLDDFVAILAIKLWPEGRRQSRARFTTQNV